MILTDFLRALGQMSDPRFFRVVVWSVALTIALLTGVYAGFLALIEWATPGSVIIETKGGATASAIDRALWYSGVRPSCVSKYGAGLAALGEDLPELKWRRALNQLNPE